MIIVNAGSAVSYMMVALITPKAVFNTADWILLALVVCSLFNVVFAVSLFSWHAWAFYGFLVTNTVIVGITIMAGIGVSIAGLLGPAVLYIAFLIKGPHGSTWQQLE